MFVNQGVTSSDSGEGLQVTVDKLGTASGTGYTGVTLYEGSNITIDDGTDTRLAIMGTLTCPSAATCSVETDSDGKVTAISGYKFSGSRSASAAVRESNGINNDYLVFGVWMDDASTPIVGAFANGATTFNPGVHTTRGDDNTWAALVGKATYKGSAAGLYTKGTSVDFFKGDATLEANFGKAPTTGVDTVLGTITGTIGNIMAGGMATGDVISLNDGNIADGGAISGNARMGAYTVKGDVATYPYNGTWSGQFHGPDAKSGAKGAAALPSDVVGTFGVTGTDDMGTTTTKDDVTTSYVGSFGASQ